MKRLLATLMAVALALCALGQTIDKNTNPGSLWDDSARNPLIDRTARRVGDLITILISESSSANFGATTDLQKSDANDIAIENFPRILQRLVMPFSTTASGDTSGSGTTTQTGRMTARMTAVVREVLPNGVLVIEGTRTVQVNNELQAIRVGGLIRRDDISAANTVRSENIGQAYIRFEGKGAIHQRQRRGILTQVLDWLF